MTALTDAELVERVAAALAIVEKVKTAVDTMWFESNDGDVVHVDHIYHALGIDQFAEQLATTPKNARPLVDPWATVPATNDDVILPGEKAA